LGLVQQTGALHWDDGNELPRVHQVRLPVHFRSFTDFRIVYRDYFGSCSLTHFRRASVSGDCDSSEFHKKFLN